MDQRSSIWSYVGELAGTVDQLWRACRGSEDRFPEVAARALTETVVPDGVDARSVLAAAAEAEVLVPQADRASRFGQPPITFFRGNRFYVDVLMWFDGTPAIHSHGFSGAFRVLDGSSVHVPYRFDAREAVTRRLAFGDLRVGDGEVLRRGDVRAIVAGEDGTHSLFHLDRPSATVVVRTYEAPWAAPQRVFFRPGIAYDDFYQDATLNRRLDALVALWRVDADSARAVAREMVAGADPFAAFLVVDRWFNAIDARDGVSDLVELLVTAHGLPAELHQMFDDRRREAALLTRRRLLHDPRHRLLLAVLVTLPDLEVRRRILAAFFPDRDPGVLIGELVSELCSPELRGLSGLVLDEPDIAVLRRTLEAGTDGPDVEEQLRVVSTRVRNLDLVQALFS
ncbi:MAG: hypothetical protein ABR511_00850 [Acidimicrobiales bacterium]